MTLKPAAIAEAASRHGLMLRGGFDFEEGEAAPAGPDGTPAKAVLLVGHAGDAYWPHFARWRENQLPDLADPLDTWSREVIGNIAGAFGARAVSPSDRPYLPFQQWAMRAECLRPSPLGILMHPQFGLWHAYRGALLFDRRVGFRALRVSNHPCDACAGKPCLNACPVGAYSEEGFDIVSCRSHVSSVAADCLDRGCHARNACPVGAEYRYRPQVQHFHMMAFAGR